MLNIHVMRYAPLHSCHCVTVLSLLGASLELRAPDDDDRKSTSEWTLRGHSER